MAARGLQTSQATTLSRPPSSTRPHLLALPLRRGTSLTSPPSFTHPPLPLSLSPQLGALSASPPLVLGAVVGRSHTRRPAAPTLAPLALSQGLTPLALSQGISVLALFPFGVCSLGRTLLPPRRRQWFALRSPFNRPRFAGSPVPPAASLLPTAFRPICTLLPPVWTLPLRWPLVSISLKLICCFVRDVSGRALHGKLTPSQKTFAL